jgi:tryptophanyl-tRNA synthetase
MSKSDSDSNSRIQLTDPADLISRKLRKAVTDSTSLVSYDPVKRPGVSTLLDIDSACTGRDPEEISESCLLRYMDTGEYKKEVARLLIEHLAPIQKKYLELINDKVYLRKCLDEGANKASRIAALNLDRICEIIGMK